MSVNINADTTNGLVLTSDTSGELKLQSAGADIATVTSSGITMASGKDMVSTGHILQVVQGTYSTQVSSTTNSLTDTGLSATITPKSSSSKILLISQQQIGKDSANNWVSLQLFRDATYLTSQNSMLYDGTSGPLHGFIVSFNYLDSPATTSAITYKTYIFNQPAIGTVFANINNNLASMALFEVAV